MPKPHTETISISLQGTWTWNDEVQGLEFVSSNASNKIKERRKSRFCHAQDLPDKRHERFTQPPAVVFKGLSSTRASGCWSNTVEARSCTYTSKMMKDQTDCVTTEHVKEAALTLLRENESQDIPVCFLTLLRSHALDDFLTGILLYLSCCFEKKKLKKKFKAQMDQSEAEQLLMAEASAKVNLARQHVAWSYSNLILGVGLPQHHHMACGSVETNNSTCLTPTGKEYHRHTQTDSCMSFVCYAAWVTFWRKNLSGIQEEVGRLVRSDTFNSLPKARRRNCKEPAVDSHDLLSLHQRCQRRPPLSRIMTQRSPLMVAIFPTPRQSAPHLFTRLRLRQQPTPAEVCSSRALREQLTCQLASSCFGILGKPLSQFSGVTLMPEATREEDQGQHD